MVIFKYQDSDTIKTGKIKLISSGFPIEADIEANGWNFHVIIGKHINGNYICIPNWNVGSELAGLEDTFWNRERLINYTSLNETNSIIIASALAKLSHTL